MENIINPENLIREIKELKIMVDKERLTRTQIEMSSEYIDIEKQMKQLAEKKQEMLSVVEDSTSELQNAKMRLFEFLRQNESYAHDLIERKFKTKKRVNPNAVLSVLQGDFDAFSSLVKITQKDLLEFCPEDKDLQKQFKKCIEVVSQEFSDFVIKE